MFSAVKFNITMQQRGQGNHLTTNDYYSSTSSSADPDHGSGYNSAAASPTSTWHNHQQTTTIVTTYPAAAAAAGSYSSTTTYPSFVSPTTPVQAAAGFSLEHSPAPPHHDGVVVEEVRKTPRDHDSDSATATVVGGPTMPQSKRSRSNLYMAPKQIPKNTFTSQVGSLVVNRQLQNPADKNDARQVIGFRRQLSSSKIEAFLSANVNDHDTDMEVDMEASRPRSMSF